jgi:nitrate reductase NapD
MASELHISSLVVHARADSAEAVAAALADLPGVVVHAHDGGRIVVTLETAREQDIVDGLAFIQRMDGVLSANLVFHHHDPASNPPGDTP